VRKRWDYAIQLTLSLVIITTLAIGCEGSLSTSAPGLVTTPPASEYPADIIGRVTIADFLHMRNLSDRHAGVGEVFWVVDISIKNKSYERAVTSDYKDWHIAVGGEVYYLEGGLTQLLHLRDKTTLDDMNIPVGQIGQTTICFSVPDTLKVSDAKLCYQGQEPYSYGKLTGGDKVAVYDWDLKTVIEEDQKEGKQQAVFYENWEFTLNSFSIKSTDVNVNISVTSHFDVPREYGPYRIVLIDQYSTRSGMIFGDTIDKEHFYGFYEGIYYPGDTKTGDLRFTVNPKSGKVSLHLYSPYMKSIMSKLFDLGEIK